jgi:hypothetical protein
MKEMVVIREVRMWKIRLDWVDVRYTSSTEEMIYQTHQRSSSGQSIEYQRGDAHQHSDNPANVRIIRQSKKYI